MAGFVYLTFQTIAAGAAVMALVELVVRLLRGAL